MIQDFADWIVYSILNIGIDSHLGKALNFFIYDSIKIILLLFAITILMGIVNAYLPVERLRNFLNSRNFYGLEYFLASAFGAITPFCTCSSIPLFIGFLKGGIPLGVTFSFLITSPLVNEVALAMFIGMFGWKITLIYAFTGIILGMIGGFILGKMKLEKHLDEWVIKIQQESQNASIEFESNKETFIQILPNIFRESLDIFKRVIPYIIGGLAIGAIIHGYVPDGFFEKYISKDNILSVPIAVILAVPMYANATGIIPMIEVFVSKGIPFGTAIAFMMSVIGLSLPEAMLLKRVMNFKLIAIFFGTITILIIISGYLFNWIL